MGWGAKNAAESRMMRKASLEVNGFQRPHHRVGMAWVIQESWPTVGRPDSYLAGKTSEFAGRLSHLTLKARRPETKYFK